MKRFFAILLCVLMLFSLVACKEEKKNTGSNGDKGEASQQSGDTAGFYAQYNSVKIELGSDAKNTITSLGTPKGSEPAGSCGGQGTLTKYTYASMEMYVLKNGDKETVDQIDFLDDTPKTAKGITIGDKKEDVVAAHGKDFSETETTITYKSGNKNLKFTLRDGAVVGITYRISG